MGLAKAAELNGYPGPAHVLELANELALTDAQRIRTEALFKQMESRAIAAGRVLVAEERALDALFASRTATQANLGPALEQIAKYAQLRGYGSGAAPSGHDHGHRKH